MSRNLIRYGRITKRLTRKGQFAVQQTAYLGKVADAHMVHPYGLHANAPADSLVLLFSVQDNPDNRAALPMDVKNWPDLAEGEVALYHPTTGGLVVWQASGNLEITTAADVAVSCANLTATATGNLSATVTGAATVTADSLSATATTTATVAAATIAANASATADITAPAINLNGAVLINGSLAFAGGAATIPGAITFSGTISQGGKDIGAAHTHTQGNDSGGNIEQNTGGVV